MSLKILFFQNILLVFLRIFGEILESLRYFMNIFLWMILGSIGHNYWPYGCILVWRQGMEISIYTPTLSRSLICSQSLTCINTWTPECLFRCIASIKAVWHELSTSKTLYHPYQVDEILVELQQFSLQKLLLSTYMMHK